MHNDAVDVEDKDSLIERSVILLGRFTEFLKKYLNYFRLHMIYFILMCIFGGLLLWISETGHMSYTDALSTITSAMCVTGLSVVDVYGLSVVSQFIIMLWILLGSTVFMSVVPLFIRLRFFKKTLARETNVDEVEPETILTGNARLEYLGVKELIKIVLTYYVLCIALGFIGLLVYFIVSAEGRNILESRGVNGIWFSVFHSVSSFNNAGYALLSDNLVLFKTSVPLLLITSFLILAGNTGFPIALYLIVWIMSMVRKQSDVYKYILKNPRKVFTHLFQLRQTLWLLLALIALNVIEAVIFLALDWNRPVLEGLDTGQKILNGYFTSISTRTAGFNTIDTSIASPALLIIQIGFMYVSAYPVALSVRYSNMKLQSEKKKKNKRTYNKVNVASSPVSERNNTSSHDGDNVMTRRSVGSNPSIDELRSPSDVESAADRQSNAQDDYRIRVTDITQPDKRFVGAARNIVARDLLWMFVIWAIIGIIEEDLLSMPGQFPVFKSLFEVVSAYGTVGLSLGTGYSEWPLAFSALWHNGAKIVLCAAMILGRHRGLPESVDRAVQLPNLMQKHIGTNTNKNSSVSNSNLNENNGEPRGSIDSADGVSLDIQSVEMSKMQAEEDDLII
jgi:Trk-type K+ transport system membrane component